MTKQEKNENDKKKRPIMDNILGTEGISDVDEKRQKQEEKKAKLYEISDEEKVNYVANIKNGITLQLEWKDILLFIVVQFIPLLLLGGAFFFFFLYYFFSTTSEWRNFNIILIVLGSMVFFYALIRLVCALSFKLEMSITEIKWRNVFWWKSILNQGLTHIKVNRGAYFYLIKVGGMISFGIEVILIASESKDYWLRAYPLRKARAEYLVKIVNCWIELTKPLAKEDTKET